MDIGWLVTAILGFILLYVICYWMNKIYYHWDSKGIPNAKSIPYLGMAMNLLVYKKSLDDLVFSLYDRFKGHKFGGYIQIATPGIFLRDPELINRILISDFSHFEDRNLGMRSQELLSQALSALSGDKWRHARHKLTPTFTSGKLKSMFDSIKECSDKVVNHLEDKTHKDFESKDLLLGFVLSVVGDVAFGMKIDAYTAKSQESSDFLKACTKLFNPSVTMLMKILIATTSLKLQELLNISVIDKDVQNYFRNLVKDLIKHRELTGVKRNDFLQLMLEQKRIEDHAAGNVKNPIKYTSTHDDDTAEDVVLLQQLKNIAPPKDTKPTKVFSDDFIAAQSFLFLAGGTENTTGIIGFALFEMAMHPECQRKVQREIDNAVSASGFNYQSLSKMTYLDQVLHETFRIHPAANVLFRICTKNYCIPGTTTIIEKGTMLMVPVVALHKDPLYYPDPEKFDPDRFQNLDSVPKGTYFAFGAGPRMCIAMRFAILEIKILLATLLSSYNVLLSKKTKLPLKLVKQAITPRVEGGLWLQFEKRNA